MCIAILKPKGKKISEDALRICFANNPDGAGFAVSDNGALKMIKGLMTFEEFWEVYEPWQEDFDSVIHFRIGTAGNKDAENCHPWAVNGETALVHNGTLHDFIDKEGTQSDSGNFAEWFVRPMLEKFGPESFLEEFVQYTLTKVVGTESKVVIFNKDGKYFIVNDKKGEWVDGIWFSNTSYKSLKSTPNDTTPHRQNDKGANHSTSDFRKVYFLASDLTETPLTDDEIKVICKREHVNKPKKLCRLGILRKKKIAINPTVETYGSDGAHALEKHWQHLAVMNPNQV
jgi:glucosamine 6-phosphate synthetase-like amidotransferase/phosphosugar isomerase protein